MNSIKKKRLERKGWKVGSAAEFLQLTPEESAYVEREYRPAKKRITVSIDEGSPG
jgi:hypothetical protein